jgi:NAD(P)-dependent dehydrogenase (short-subunit alcohol dehydrogenase family)
VVALSTGSNPETEKVLAELGKLGDITYVACDISKREDCKKAVDLAVKTYGRIDVLANVAGIVGQQGDLVDNSLDVIEQVIQINLMGSIYMAKYAAEQMVAQKSGVIVNVGSICGIIANHENVAYHASKGAIRMFTQALARELSPHGVRCVSVAPGWINTEMLTRQVEKNGTAMLEGGSKMHMKGNIIQPEEIANAIYLMTLPEASCINGSTVMADDGYAEFKGVDAPISWK